MDSIDCTSRRLNSMADINLIHDHVQTYEADLRKRSDVYPENL